MKIFLTSDTHGSITKDQEVLATLSDIDLIIHCGDYKDDGQWLSEVTGIPAVCVHGNSDRCNPSDFTTVDTPYGKILVIHGHMQLVEFRLDNLLYQAMEKDCTAACYGHTHIAAYEEVDGIHLINPGSLTDPRDGSGGTFAIITSTENDFYVDIVRYDTFMDSHRKAEPPVNSESNSQKKNAPKVKGGFLRKLLNYSDRF